METSKQSILNFLASNNKSGLTKDTFDFTLADTITITGNASDNEQTFFTVPYGQQGKTLADTNVSSAGLLPIGKKHTVFGLKLFILAGYTDAPIPASDFEWLRAFYYMCYNTTLEFKLGGKEEFGQWTLAEILGLNIGFVGSTIHSSSYLRDNVKDVFPINVPIELASQQQFKVRLKHQTGTPPAILHGTKIKLGLAGLLQNMA